MRVMPLALALPLAICGASCAGEARPEEIVLEREVAGLREAVARLERGEPVLPSGDVVVVMRESVIQDLLVAQLPFDIDVDPFHVQLDGAEVAFQGSTAVRLQGRVTLAESAAYVGHVRVYGALDDVAVDVDTGTLAASVRVDAIDVTQAAGVGCLVKGGAALGLDRFLRTALQGLIPRVRLAVNAEPLVVLPAITRGPVRVSGASMRIRGAVSGVFAGLGELWVSMHVHTGELVKTAAAPAPRPAATHEAAP